MAKPRTQRINGKMHEVVVLEVTATDPDGSPRCFRALKPGEKTKAASLPGLPPKQFWIVYASADMFKARTN